MAFIDATCSKCGSKIGWQGTMLDRPACPDCGFRPSNDELMAAENKLDAIRREVDAERQAELANATDEELAAMTEGRLAYKPEYDFLEVHRINPYKGGPLSKWFVRGWRQESFKKVT